MTTRTTIPTDPHDNTGSPDGPIDCARCGLSLVDREPDETTRDTATWIHDTGDGDQAICDDCHDQSEQAACWLDLARWRGRSDMRGFYFSRAGLSLYEGQTAGPTFSAPRAKLPVEEIRSWLATDPLRHSNLVARLERLIDGECPPTERNLEHLADKAEHVIGGW